MFIKVPSSIPCGWGRISFVQGGSASVALLKMYLFPSGSVNVTLEWGLTIAVCLRYSRTDCFPVTYRPVM